MKMTLDGIALAMMELHSSLMVRSYLNVSMQPTGMNLGEIFRRSVKRKYDFVLHHLSLSVEFKSSYLPASYHAFWLFVCKG